MSTPKVPPQRGLLPPLRLAPGRLRVRRQRDLVGDDLLFVVVLLLVQEEESRGEAEEPHPVGRAGAQGVGAEVGNI